MNNRQVCGRSLLVIDRGWSLHVGPIKLVQWHRCYADDVSPELRPKRTKALLFSGRAALSALVVCICTFAATNLVAERLSASSAYAITIPVPPMVRHRHNLRPALGSGHRDEHAAVAATMMSRRRLAALAPPAVRDPPELSIGKEEVSLQSLSSEARSRTLAVQTALSTGGLQEWREVSSARHGFVVAGPLRQDGGRQCRMMSVLTRSADGDVVEQRHECLR